MLLCLNFDGRTWIYLQVLGRLSDGLVDIRALEPDPSFVRPVHLATPLRAAPSRSGRWGNLWMLAIKLNPTLTVKMHESTDEIIELRYSCYRCYDGVDSCQFYTCFYFALLPDSKTTMPQLETISPGRISMHLNRNANPRYLDCMGRASELPVCLVLRSAESYCTV